ncbi:MAG: DNA polymerase [Clostridiales bacterium]|nr:DNA polymerase [Clostridiales bacterium]
MKRLQLDIETFSSEPLQKCGVYRYASAEDFAVLLFGYSVDGGDVQVIDLAQGEKIPTNVLAALEDRNIVKWSFNSNFERVCLSRYLGYPMGDYLEPSSWRCSMIWSAYMGLPLSLKGVGAVLGLDKQKLIEGKDLIKYFCQPCAPTKANGGRMRNLPSDAPEKWELFKSYNLRDVEVEMQITQRLAKFPVPDFIWDEFHLSEEINDRGVRLDMPLVRQAINMDTRSRSELSTAMKKLTELDNPNSVAQMKDWLADNGLETDTLGKKAVSELLKTAPPELRDVLSLRQQLAKSSVKKYTAMGNAVCSDSRVRGMFMFLGASRTGRFSSKTVQLQNLPMNNLKDLSEARALVRGGNYDALEMLYEDVPDTLSQLIRTAFVPQNGRKFIVADFSAIEARVIAWFAGEEWRTEVFKNDGDIYCMSASAMFHVPVEKHGVNGELRQKGKIAELACIAEGQLVLTDCGLIPVENVTTDMRVWDGESWVRHDGVVFRGEREVIEYDGLTATTDHLVWIEGQSNPLQFGTAASGGKHLLQTGNGVKPIQLGENHNSKTVSGIKPDRDNPGCGNSSLRETKELETNKRTARLYDIRNAGEHHRFTVSGVLVHNCGYGGSVGALKAMGALEMGLKESELQPIVDSWRGANPNIVKFWWAVDRAAKAAIKGKTHTTAYGITFSYESGFLFITLPSGRRLAYVKPRIGENRFGGEAITYEGTGGTKKWERLETYGSKFVENIVQATSRDILCYAMKTMHCCDIVAHVHDEVIIEAERAMSLDAVCEQMGRTPPWAPGLILRADGYECDFYKKD